MDATDEMFKQTGAALAASSLAAKKKVMGLCLETEELAEAIAQAEATLAGLKTRQNILLTDDLPMAMSELGAMDWSSENGRYKVSVSDFVAGTLPKEGEARTKATDLIAEYGGGALIKTEVSLSFGKDENKEATKLRKLLVKSGFDATVTTGIHPASLLSFIRERLEDGEPVDFKTLGIFNGRKAKVKVVEAKDKAPTKTKPAKR